MTDWTTVVSTGFTAPGIRGDTAYPVLALWTARGVLDAHLAALGDRLVDRPRHDGVRARTFVFPDRGVRWFEPATGTPGTVVRLPHAEPVKERLAPVLRPAWRGPG